jgi:UDP-N-acetylmuramoyl-L-alanyl-D-glutamate--2,6-diaminopimelate ligase
MDDPFGVQVSKNLANAAVEIIGYGFTDFLKHIPLTGYAKNRRVMRGRDLKSDSEGLTFNVEFESEKVEFKAGVIGGFNASNLLGVLATLVASGVKLGEAAEALRTIRPVAGRMEQMGGGDSPLIVIDYAHTPDALEKVLTTVREIVEPPGSIGQAPGVRRVICVFGCGGDRDRGKRPLMGEVATRLADEVIITSDNPRKEDKGAIIREIISGARRGNFRIEEDRRQAIHIAISSARKGDAIVIAGKGHEAYQELDGQKLPFSDNYEARLALSARGNDCV